MTDAQMNEIKWFIELVGSIIIVIQVVSGFILIRASRQIAKNEVELADLLRQAVDKIESDLLKK
jgi:Tfp pilus assembly protein PilW